ncbi:hypothetical protein IBT49_07640 [Erwinia sp. S63]|nr:hypothetical protein [Erwinia sp. S63]
MLMSIAELTEFSELADEYMITGNDIALVSLVEKYTSKNFAFAHPIHEAHYLYCLGTCYSDLHEKRKTEWYSDDLMKSVIAYRKAIHALPKHDWSEHENVTNARTNLRSRIETNLAIQLSSQGRALCCLPHFDKAISLDENPVAINSKAINQIFLGDSLYDQYHSGYHYFKAYELTNQALDNIDKLYPEQRVYLEKDGQLSTFKDAFENKYDLDSFYQFKEYKQEYSSKKEKEYLEWCGENRLFLNDLNDVCNYPIVYQDVFSLPSFIQTINSSLTMHEELSYHGNYDELKNDYCYARYLIFTAKDIPNDTSHMFNSTYQHVDDMSYSINNLKVAHYKSAFRALYSLFDKIAYFINRFFDLNDIKHDRSITIESLFRDITVKGGGWKPHKKLKESDNHFIHALFFILRDLRKVGDSEEVTKWLDPHAVAFVKIRNAMEHRSLKIVDDFGYELATANNPYNDNELLKMEEELSLCESKITDLQSNKSMALGYNVDELNALNIRKDKLDQQLKEKKKLSSHSLLIPISQFEKRLCELMRLARNSIMYLALAIHHEERKRNRDGVYMTKEVPLK